ncbi:radical SAM protein [Lactococcus cremoris]|nr:radical SAM protein [Lactococcus cremoris]
MHLNYDCNLKCSYCYQNVITEKVVMNDKTEKDVIEFIRKIVLDKNPEYIYLNFIGGEPTLHTDKMIRIMQACNKINNSFYFSVVSNGTFGNMKKIEELLHLGLNDYFITLDGARKDHDKYRVYESGKGSFSTIIRNLKRIQEKFPEINIKLNSNLNDENKNHVTELLDVLEEKEIKYPLLFSKVISTANGKFDKTIEDNDSFWYQAHKQPIYRGYDFKPYGREINLACMMKQTNCFIIGADGFLFSCIEAVGMNEFRQAHVNDYGSAMFEIIRSQAQNIGYAYDTCDSCEFLPNCDGGCYYKRSHDDFVCPKSSFENDSLMIIKEIFEVKS